MIGIVIVAHGGLAREYLAAMEHVIGTQKGVAAISVAPNDSCAQRQPDIDAAVAEVDTGDGVVVLTDMLGSTPSNLAVGACKSIDHKVLYGVNLPLLIKLAKARKLPIDQAIASALSAGRKYIDSVDGFEDSQTPVAL